MADLKNGGFDFELKKKGIKKTFFKFCLILILSTLEIIMQKKNKSEKIISSAPKTAVTLIIAATLTTGPTVYSVH